MADSLQRCNSNLSAQDFNRTAVLELEDLLYQSREYLQHSSTVMPTISNGPVVSRSRNVVVGS
jgi:hypothetical protein